jgi:hypothetical protein
MGVLWATVWLTTAGAGAGFSSLGSAARAELKGMTKVSKQMRTLAVKNTEADMKQNCRRDVKVMTGSV